MTIAVDLGRKATKQTEIRYETAAADMVSVSIENNFLNWISKYEKSEIEYRKTKIELHVSSKNENRTNSKTCLKRPLKKTKIGFQDRLSLNAGQKYC